MRFFVFLICFLISNNIFASDFISPLNFGLDKAKTDIERYLVLLECHKEAIRRNKAVSYVNIDTIRIEIPLGAKSIPLSSKTDFSNVVIIVENNVEDLCLFEISSRYCKTDIPFEMLRERSRLNFLNEKAVYLVSVEDKNTWVKERSGYSYPAIRKDLLVVNEGMVQNDPIVPYNRTTSSPKCVLANVAKEKGYFRNLSFERSTKSKFITRLLTCNFQYNFIISNVKVKTPEDENLYGDAIFTIQNSAKILFDNIVVSGTYSQSNKYGYAFSLGNVYDIMMSGLKCEAKWGAFCVNCAQKVEVKNSKINRFDLHCYGRDFKLKKCFFNGTSSGYSSMFGQLEFEHCVFSECSPVSFRQDYNANTPFDLSFSSCTFNLNRLHPALVYVNGLSDEINIRPELSQKCLPNINVENCMINLSEDINKWFVFYMGKVNYKLPVEYIKKISIKNILVNKDADFDALSRPVKTKNKLNIKCTNYRYHNSKGIIEKKLLNKATLGDNALMIFDGNKVSSVKYIMGIKANYIYWALLIFFLLIGGIAYKNMSVKR